MAVVMEKPIQVTPITWRLQFRSTLSPIITFRIFREGRLLASLQSHTQSAHYDTTVMPTETPAFEIFDDTVSRAHPAFPGRLTLQWYAIGNASYLVQRFVGAAWVDQRSIPDDGRGWYTYLTDWLEDTTQHQYRVLPVSSQGNQGTALTLGALQVRHPDVPRVTLTYSGGTKRVTVSAA